MAFPTTNHSLVLLECVRHDEDTIPKLALARKQTTANGRLTYTTNTNAEEYNKCKKKLLWNTMEARYAAQHQHRGKPQQHERHKL